VGGHLPWAHRAVIGAGCLAANGVVCRACGDHCETGAIRFRLAPGGRSFAQVELARCTGCGGCVGICPVGAVVMQVPAPAEAAA
jgi:ferredoxin-type protein NapF